MSRRRNVEVVPLMEKDDDWKEQDLDDLVLTPLNDILDNIKHYPQIVPYRELWKSIILISLFSFILGIIVSYFLYDKFLSHPIRNGFHEKTYIYSEENVIGNINLKNIEDYHRILQQSKNDELLSYIKNNWLKEGLDIVDILPYNFHSSLLNEGKSEQILLTELNQNDSEIMKFGNNNFYEARCIYCDCSILMDQIIIGDLVYANYARLSDFLQLQELKVNVSGKIVIAQIGEISIANKLFIAKQFNANGLILFHNQSNSLKKSIINSTIENGFLHDNHCSELLQIGGLSVKENGKIKISSQMIPVFHISFEIATNLLRQMIGPTFPDNWIINNNLSYKLGPGFEENNKKMKMEIKMQNSTNQTDYILIGKIFGRKETDRTVMIGISKQNGQLKGISTLLEIIHIFGKMLKSGKRPRRTILFCIWGFTDVESFSFIKWIKENQEKLEAQTVSYIDISSLKIPKIISSPLLHKQILRTIEKVSKINELEKEKLHEKWLKKINEDKSENCNDGSNYDLLYYSSGIPSIHFKFNWDLYNMISGQILLEIIQSLSDDSILPFDCEAYSLNLKNTSNYLQKQYGNLFTKNGISLNSLESAIKEFDIAKELFIRELKTHSQSTEKIKRSINDKLMKLEKAWIDFNGLPIRKNYKHVLFGTNASNICNLITFPGINDLFFMTKINPEKPFQEDVIKHISILIFHINALTKILKENL